jgi:predicted DNA-binding transcriptional regulator AlpA
VRHHDRLLRRADVIERCDISDATVDRWIKAGYLQPIRLGRRIVRFLASDVDRLVTEGTPKARAR